MGIETATEKPAVSREGKAKCAFCGRAWFGDVAYCPYCGHGSADAPPQATVAAPAAAGVHAVPHPAPGGSPRQSVHLDSSAARTGMRWRGWWTPVALVVALAIVAAAGVMTRDKPAPRTAPAADAAPAATSAPPVAHAPPGARQAGTTAGPAPVPAAEPPAPRAVAEPQPSAPAVQRSLCSAANEAAGLCKPQ